MRTRAPEKAVRLARERLPARLGRGRRGARVGGAAARHGPQGGGEEREEGADRAHDGVDAERRRGGSSAEREVRVPPARDGAAVRRRRGGGPAVGGASL